MKISLFDIQIFGDNIALKLAVNGLRPDQRGSEYRPMTGAIAYTFDSSASSSPPALAFEPDPDLFQQLQLRENCEYDFSLYLPVTLNEYRTQRLQNPSFPFVADSVAGIVTFNSEDAFSIVDGKLRITGRINYKHRAGIGDLSIEAAGERLPIYVEVLTTKLDYEAEFRALLDALSDIGAELLLRLDTAVEAILNLSDARNDSPLSAYLQLRHLFKSNKLAEAAAAIQANPARRVDHAHVRQPIELCAIPDFFELASNPGAVDWIEASNGFLALRGFLPRDVLETMTTLVEDVPENRFIKYALEQVVRELEEIKVKLPLRYSAAHRAVARWHLDMVTILAFPFWRSIKAEARYPNSMILLQRRGYREIVTAITAFALGLARDGAESIGTINSELRPVFELYELWCFIQIYHAVQALTGEQGTPSLELAHNKRDFVFSFQRSGNLAYKFDLAALGYPSAAIALYYNRSFLGNGRSKAPDTHWEDTYSLQLRPDISLRIVLNGTAHWIHFDAKYRLDGQKIAEELRLVEDGGRQRSSDPTYKSDDIHVMHTYRDALLGTRGSYILYPGKTDEPNRFVRHGSASYRQQYPLPGIGAFPLTPGPDGKAMQIDDVIEFLRQAILVLAGASRYVEEEGIA